MRIDQWTHDLPSRLELAAEIVDDLATSDWVVSDDHRDRLFAVEVQIWRIAQTTRKAAGQLAELVPFLDRSLRAVRSNVRLCLKIPVCDEDDGVELLEGVGREFDEAIAEFEVLTRTDDPPFRVVAGGRS